MSKLSKILTPARIIALGFAALILIGSLLLMMPFSIKEGVHLDYIDALYTSTSAVCVTGLIAVDVGDTFTRVGQVVVMLLIQLGGLGVTAVGTGIILAVGKKITFRGLTVVKEGMNLDSAKDMVRFIRSVFLTTLAFELTGAALSFIVFVRDYSVGEAMFISLFHSVAAFNNSGFDILGNYQNLIPYQNDILLNLVTCALIIFGGIGFLVIREMFSTRFRWKKFSMHTKVVLLTTAALLLSGTLLIKATEDITWLGAFFFSVSSRTAGFSTFPLGQFTNAGLFTITILMFIGASPGSTGGGIKTTTFFALMQQVRAVFTKKKPGGFHRTLPGEAIDKAGVIALLSVVVVCVGTFLLCVLEPELDFVRLLFEEVSAFGTVGLSTGITPDLSVASKLVLIFTMYIGRLGAFTLFSLWIDRPDPSIRYTEEMITIG